MKVMATLKKLLSREAIVQVIDLFLVICEVREQKGLLHLECTYSKISRDAQL